MKTNVIQFTGLNFDEIEVFVGGDVGKNANGNTVVAGPRGPLVLTRGCFITKDLKGNFSVTEMKKEKSV